MDHINFTSLLNSLGGIGRVRSSQRRCSVKISVPRNFVNFTGKHFCWSVLLIKFFSPSGLQVYENKTPTQVFNCEIHEISRNIYFEKHLQTTASVVSVVWSHKRLLLVEINGRSQNFSAGGTDDFMNFYYDPMKFYLGFYSLLYILSTNCIVMNFWPNWLYVTFIHISLFPWEDIISKNQKVKSMYKILQYEKFYWIVCRKCY